MQGVSYEPQRSAWKARLHHQGREWFIGRFETAQAACVAFDTVARAVNAHPGTKRRRALNYPLGPQAPTSDDPQVAAKLQEIMAALDAAASASSHATGDEAAAAAGGGLTAPALATTTFDSAAPLMQLQQQPFQAAAGSTSRTAGGKRGRAGMAGEPPLLGQAVRRTLSCGVLAHGQPLAPPAPPDAWSGDDSAASGAGAAQAHAPAAAARTWSEPLQAESALAGSAPPALCQQQQQQQPESLPVLADGDEDLANLLDFFLSNDAVGTSTPEKQLLQQQPFPSQAAGSMQGSGSSSNEGVAVLAHATTLGEAAAAVSSCLHAVLEGSIQSLLAHDLAGVIAATQGFLERQAGSSGTAAAMRMMQHLQHLLSRAIQAHGLSGPEEGAFVRRVFQQLQAGLLELQKMLIEAAALPQAVDQPAGVVHMWAACAWQKELPVEPVVVQLAQLF